MFFFFFSITQLLRLCISMLGMNFVIIHWYILEKLYIIFLLYIINLLLFSVSKLTELVNTAEQRIQEAQMSGEGKVDKYVA